MDSLRTPGNPPLYNPLSPYSCNMNLKHPPVDTYFMFPADWICILILICSTGIVRTLAAMQAILPLIARSGSMRLERLVYFCSAILFFINS